MKSILLTLASLCFAATAQAQWQSTTYTLKGGWNSIYLHGDASYATPDELFAANPEVLEVWRWNPNPTQVGFIQSPLIPSAGTAEWSVWKRGSPAESSLTQLIGQMAYLVKCSGTKSNTYSVPLKQSPQLPANSWVRNGANLLGFPAYKNGSTYPTISAYFATFPAAIAANTKIYQYAGGDLGTNNPVQLFTTSEKLDRNQAYWFSAEVTGDYYAPLEISPSSNRGLAFGRDGSGIKVLVRNRSSSVVTLTLAPVASESAPSGQTAIVGAVPLTKRSFNATTLLWTETPISSAYTETIGANSTVELSFGIDRGDALMTAADSDALFASLLRITDSGNLMDVYLPATAQVSSLAGLWIGDITLTNVSNKVSNGAQATATVTTDGVITGLTVVGSGGFGYTSPPEVTIAAPHANGNLTASATATKNSSGRVIAVTPVAVGSGYSSPPNVTISPPPASVTATAAVAISDGSISNNDLTNAGTNYTVAPTVTLSPPPESVSATATAEVQGGELKSVDVVTAGSYYASAPEITISAPPARQQATATASVQNGALVAVNPVLAGSYYAVAPVVTVGAPPAAVRATATAVAGNINTIIKNVVKGITLTNGGGYYSTPPTVTITGGGGSGATATATVVDGVVTGINLTNLGNNYTSNPTVTLSAPPPSVQAVVNVTLSGGGASSYSIVNPGWGYAAAPAITLPLPPSNAAATATCSVSSGGIVSYSITNPGWGYPDTPAPTVTIAPTYVTPVQATATASWSNGSVSALNFSNMGAGYLVAPTVTFSAPPAAAPAAAAAVMSNGTVTGYNVTAAGSGYTAVPTVSISGPPANAQATATATVADGSVTGFTLNSGGSGYEKAPAVTIGLPPPQAGSSTPTPFKLRTLLHLSDGGTARLLSEVYIGQLAVAPNEVGLCTSESLLKQDALASAQCFSSAHLPMDQVITSGGGSFATGETLTRVITVPYNDATNPFVHAYHPDHDNKTARGDDLAAGVESPNITRTCEFIFTASPPAGSSVTSGWASSVIGGNYIETMTGIHKDPIILSGTFELRRASQIGTLSQ